MPFSLLSCHPIHWTGAWIDWKAYCKGLERDKTGTSDWLEEINQNFLVNPGWKWREQAEQQHSFELVTSQGCRIPHCTLVQASVGAYYCWNIHLTAWSFRWHSWLYPDKSKVLLAGACTVRQDIADRQSTSSDNRLTEWCSGKRKTESVPCLSHQTCY